MKKFLVLCLLMAIGAVGLIDKSQAYDVGQFCMTHAGAPGCPPMGPDGGNGYGNPGQPQPPGGWKRPFPPGPGFDGGPFPHHHHHGNWQPYLGFRLLINPGLPPPSYCDALASSLSRQGFRVLQELNCSGGTYVYLARRDGELLRLYVSAATGRIRSIRPAY